MNLCRTYCRRLARLYRANRLGKVVFPDGQISDDLFVDKFVPPVCTSDNLFVSDDLSVQTICSSASVKTAIDTDRQTDIFQIKTEKYEWNGPRFEGFSFELNLRKPYT